MESAHHQEVSVSHRMGNTNFQVAMFSDRVADPALTGVGDVTAAGGFLLPDIFSGTFSYAGRTLDTERHARGSAAQIRLRPDRHSGLRVRRRARSYPARRSAAARRSSGFRPQRRHAVAAKLSGTFPHPHPLDCLLSLDQRTGPTPVDMFNASAGTERSLSEHLHPPAHPHLGGHMEALIDIRNLLAQGYVPVLGQDGQTVYLVDSARSVRGGVAFTF